MRRGGRESQREPEIGVPATTKLDGQWIVQPGDDVEKWAAFNDRELAAAFVEGLLMHPGESLRLASLLDLPIPPPEALAGWRGITAQLTGEHGATALEEVLDAVDACVAEDYGLPQLELETNLKPTRCSAASSQTSPSRNAAVLACAPA